MLKDNEVIGIISGKQELTELTINQDNTSGNILKDPDSNQFGPNEPYSLITTSIPIMGTSILGNDRIIHIFARGFKFDSNGPNSVNKKIDRQLIKRTFKMIQDGTVSSNLKVPDVSDGRHTIQVIQEMGGNEIVASRTFMKANIEDFDEDQENNNA
jgi:hypothetical protein